MSEEEIIKELKSEPDYSLSYYKRENAIQGLLDLYNKEKEKNKELEKYKKYYEIEKVVWNRKDYISKDKIEERIKNLEISLNDIEDDLSVSASKYDTINELNIKINILQELLEERN